MASGTGYTVGAPASATGTIDDNDTPAITVAATDADRCGAAANTIVFTVTRTGNTTVSTAVTLAWSGTATLTTDYTVASTGATISADRLTLTFAAGSATATVTVTPVNDTLSRRRETVILTLAAGSRLHGRRAPRRRPGTIADNDTPAITVAATDADRCRSRLEPIVFTVTRTGTRRARPRSRSPGPARRR